MEPGVHAAQLDRIIAVIPLANVSIAVITQDAPLETILWCGFDLFDERDPGYQPLVVIEMPHRADETSDPDDVELYRSHLSAIRDAAVCGDEAVAAIRAVGTRP